MMTIMESLESALWEQEREQNINSVSYKDSFKVFT